MQRRKFHFSKLIFQSGVKKESDGENHGLNVQAVDVETGREIQGEVLSGIFWAMNMSPYLAKDITPVSEGSSPKMDHPLGPIGYI